MRALRSKRMPGLPGRINEALVILREQRSCPHCLPVFDRVRRVLLGAPTVGVDRPMVGREQDISRRNPPPVDARRTAENGAAR